MTDTSTPEPDDVGEPDEGEQPEDRRRQYANLLDAEWIGQKVRVRVGDTIIIEDVLTGIYHFSTVTRLYFKDTKSFKTIFSQDDGYQVARHEMVEVIP